MKWFFFLSLVTLLLPVSGAFAEAEVTLIPALGCTPEPTATPAPTPTPEPTPTPLPTPTPTPAPVLVDRLGGDTSDFTFAKDTPLLEVFFPQILDSDACLLRFGEETLLIDTGTQGQARRVLDMCRQLGITHIDRVINTHPHSDHLEGFRDIIKEVTVGELWLCHPEDTTVHSQNAVRFAANAGIPVYHFGDGDTFTLGGATLEVRMLAWEGFVELNDRSAQIKLTYGSRTMYFAADLEHPGQQRAAEEWGDWLRADILKYPHHGKEKLVEEYREAVSPLLVVVTNNQRDLEGKRYIRSTGLNGKWTVPGFVTLKTDGATWVCERIESKIKY